MTDTSADYYAAEAMIYRDLATMLSVIFGFMAAVLIRIIAAETSSADLASKLGELANIMIVLVAILGIIFASHFWVHILLQLEGSQGEEV